MRPDRKTIRNVRSLMAVALVAAAEALCQEKQAGAQPPADDASLRRRIVVSIPDRKLALVENGRVVKIYPAAVGAPVSPTPRGTFTIVQRIPNPTWYVAGRGGRAGQRQSAGPALDRSEPQELRDSWNQQPAVHRAARFSWVCSHAQQRCKGPVRAGSGGRRGGTARRARCRDRPNLRRNRNRRERDGRRRPVKGELWKS